METLQSRLIKARKKAGMTQEELAKAAGVSQVTIQQLESGRNKSSRKLVDIAKALGVSADWLGSKGDLIKPSDFTDVDLSFSAITGTPFVNETRYTYKIDLKTPKEDKAKKLADSIIKHHKSGEISDSFIDAINILIDCQKKTTSKKSAPDQSRSYIIDEAHNNN